jgi:DNA-binding NarL/FixJ family response regulator
MTMKRERLDDVLLRLGYVDDAQIRQALLRQKARGGRLGTNLLFLKHVTEEQLAHALSEQYHVPAYDETQHPPDPEVVRSLPAELAEQFMAVPIARDRGSGSLILATVDPDDTRAFFELEQRLGASQINVRVAPESVIHRLLHAHHRGHAGSKVEQIVELPDLFEGQAAAEDDELLLRDGAADAEHLRRNVLMVSGAPFLRNFLGPIFEREGYVLQVHGQPEEIAGALRGGHIDQVLVAQDALEGFSRWIRNGAIPAPRGEVSVFSTVSGALLHNPVPYSRVMGSLLESLKLIARYRCAGAGWMPPYELICKDLRKLGLDLGFRRLALDGLQVAAHLLVLEKRDEAPAGRGGKGVRPLVLVDFDQTLELGRSLRFPWDLEGVLTSFLHLISELIDVEKDEGQSREHFLAAQALAIVWYRHSGFAFGGQSAEELLAALKSGLRAQAGRLASSAVVEAYVRVLDDSKHEVGAGAGKQIFILGPLDEQARQFRVHLERAGFKTVHSTDLSEALRLARRQPPAAMLLDHDHFGGRALAFRKAFAASAPVLFFAHSSQAKPSLIIDLLEAGFLDVFVPPHNYDVLVTRIAKSLDSLARQGAVPSEAGSFSASFQAFAFIELIQALGQSLKTVRIVVTSDRGETADVYLKDGQLHSAVCGSLAGERAIYEVVRWGDAGWFQAEPVRECPPPNIAATNESVLLEGCRLLDERLPA